MTPMLRHLACLACLGLLSSARAQPPAPAAPAPAHAATAHIGNAGPAPQPAESSGMLVVDPTANVPAQATTYTRRRVLHLYVGQVRVINSAPVARIAIGNGKMIGVTALKNQIVLIAQKAGESDLYVWNKDGSQTNFHLIVQPADIAQVQADVNAVLHGFPDARSEVRGGQIVLTGALTPARFKALQKALKAYPDVVDLVQGDAVHMRRMVELDVQVVNFDKSALKNLGINWQQSIIGPAAGLVGDFHSNGLYRLGDVSGGGATAGNTLNNAAGALTGLPLSVSPFSSYLGLVTSITSAINLAVTDGQAYILANPRLVTRSGQSASFLAGGEVPIPEAGALGTTSVTYKPYGVKLHIAPQVDAQGHILATIQTELSQIDPNVSVNGYPGFLTRKTDAVVNVLPGQTIVLSGLINSVGSNDVNKVPGLGNLPVLGTLFRSTQFQRNQSELVIFVTPHIVTPESARNTALISQARGYAARFDRDFRSGYFVPGVGRDIDAVPYPRFPSSAAPAGARVTPPTAPGAVASPVPAAPAAP